MGKTKATITQEARGGDDDGDARRTLTEEDEHDEEEWVELDLKVRCCVSIDGRTEACSVLSCPVLQLVWSSIETNVGVFRCDVCSR